MPIGIEKQFLFDLRTEEGNDLLSFGSLGEFTAIESCMLLMPVFYITFRIQDLEAVSYFNEGAILKVALAKERKDLKYINLQVLKYEDISQQQDKIIKLTATLYKPQYSKLSRCETYKNKTSIEVLKKIIQKHFILESNIDLTTDRQNWIQHGVSDKIFIDKISRESYLSSGFLALGCTAFEDKFIIKDIVKEFSRPGYDFKIGTQIQDPEKDFIISGPPTTVSDTGFYNSGFANDKILLGFNPLTEEFLQKKATISTLLSTSDKVSKNTQAGTEVERIKITHNDYLHYTKKYNILALSNYSKFNLLIPSIGLYHNVKLLDKVFLDMADIKRDYREFWSGHYLVTKVIRTIRDNKYSTTIKISRESSGVNKGKDL